MRTDGRQTNCSSLCNVTPRTKLYCSCHDYVCRQRSLGQCSCNFSCYSRIFIEPSSFKWLPILYDYLTSTSGVWRHYNCSTGNHGQYNLLTESHNHNSFPSSPLQSSCNPTDINGAYIPADESHQPPAQRLVIRDPLACIRGYSVYACR